MPMTATTGTQTTTMAQRLTKQFLVKQTADTFSRQPIVVSLHDVFLPEDFETAQEALTAGVFLVADSVVRRAITATAGTEAAIATTIVLTIAAIARLDSLALTEEASSTLI